ncbi:MAG: mannosyltransferase family protein [Oculatellaceae cyanobacterium bins.114]|nr:mannosyltransferase family protein [Oculatellaceae cyanobacterium bins.114]
MTDHAFDLPNLNSSQLPLREAVRFATVMWLSSRFIILLCLLVIAPALPTPDGGEAAIANWTVFSRWDSRIYDTIVASGYRFENDGGGHNVAFFPLFPLLIKVATEFGLSFEVAGTLINNAAFWGALIVVYLWVHERHNRAIARWATAALAWCPFSLFGTVIYTEGLFLLCSTLALRSFDKQLYGWAAVWGALTTAIRPPGIALIPTFLMVAWQERRTTIAYITAIASSTGLLLYMLYCGVWFGQPLAFVLAQRGWQSDDQAFHGAVWLSRMTEVLMGPANQDEGRIVDPWYPIALILLGGIAVLLWRSRHRLGFPKTGYGFCILVVALWLVGGSILINLVMVFGGAYLLWHTRHSLGRVAFTYGVFSWLIILSTGRTTSAERYAYGVVSLAIALGLVLSRYPRWGYATLIFFGILMASLSVRFAQGLWAG